MMRSTVEGRNNIHRYTTANCNRYLLEFAVVYLSADVNALTS